MNRSIETRLLRLESARRAGRQFFMWDNSALDPQFDLENEKARFIRARGVTDNDEIVLVRWMDSDQHA